MGSRSHHSFEEIATIFADYGQSIRGFVRYKLTQGNLEPYSRRKKLRVLDVGGGSGPDTGWLAREGHTVTLLEPSEKQRIFAQRRFNYFLPAAARNRITIKPCTLADLPQEGKYDLVLLHGVAMYQSEPHKFILQAAQRLKKDGVLSLVEKGYYGAVTRALTNRNFKELRQLRRTQCSYNHVGQKVWSFLPEELESTLKEAGLNILEWKGIRLITDAIDASVNDFRASELSVILEAEAEHGSNANMRGQAQLLHFIARKK